MPLLFVLSLLAGAAQAQEVRVTGAVQHPLTLGVDALRSMPGEAAQVSGRIFSGPLLWGIVRQAGPVDASGEGAAGRSHLQHVVIARGQDGYAVAIAIGEIDPKFEGKKVVVSLPHEGQTDLRLAVPGDGKAGRSVHDLVELEVR